MTMPLTQDKIDKIKAPHPSGKQVLIWDSKNDPRGFGLLVSGKTNTKTFVVQGRVNRKTRRITIAPVNVIDVAEARKRARAIVAQFYKGEDPKEIAKQEIAERERAERRAQTLHMALDHYLARPKLSSKTRKLYEHLITRHLKGWLDTPLAEITRAMVKVRHREIKREVDRGDKQTGTIKTTGGSTADGVLRVLRAVYNYALDDDDDEILPANPVRLGEDWYGSPKRETCVPSDDLPKFYAAICALEPMAADFLKLVLFTGMRRREAAALKWSELDFALEAIRLSASRTKAGRKLDLPMSDYVFDLLHARREIGKDPRGFVFPASSKSGHIEEPRFYLAQIAEKTGISVTPHDLRRTFVTVASGSNISPNSLKLLVNHSLGTKDVTDGYIIATLNDLRVPMQIAADKMKELCKIKPAKGAPPKRAVPKPKGAPVRNKGGNAHASSV